ncbi:SURF1 family protein [Pseudomarimonas arenosa]|uniref:SURF1-like protein n=1 Tax=Pseudomarimonas arenosa TaxID=2774145 RepID=A0AAW3ZKK6_9GAMM|nr:SURF1 family protein [Pseudomarimonas arenosa]MBD8525717.1 SURF1 family protein [Pseudomarimonas arenosa]
MQLRAERWWLWAAALLVAALCSRAALWQYERAQWKTQYLADWEAALTAPAEPLATLDLARPVTVPTRVDAALRRQQPRWLLLDNQLREGRPGWRAFAAYAGPTDAALLVDFGWMPTPHGRQIPALPPPPLTLHAQGLLMPWPGQGIVLAEDHWPDGEAPVLLVNLDHQQIAGKLNMSLVHGVLRLTGDEAGLDGLDREQIALPNTLSPEQHYGYALQWAGFAFTVLVIALLLQLRSRRK